MNLSKSYQDLMNACSHRVMVMAGDFSAEFRLTEPSEETYRGELFADSFVPLFGNDEVLSLTAPQKVKKIQRDFFEAGADAVIANSGNANRFSQSKFRLENMAYDMAKASAEIARTAMDEYNADLSRLGKISQRKFVVGHVAALNTFPAEASFAELVQCFEEQARGLLDGGADILWVETAFNSLVGKAAVYAVVRECEIREELFPIVISKKLDECARKFTAPNAAKSVYHSLSGFPIFGIGMDFPNTLDNVHVRTVLILDDKQISSFALNFEQTNTLPNVVGGFYGLNLESVRKLSRFVRGRKPRPIPANDGSLYLCGLEPLEIKRDSEIVQISENLWSATLAENASHITHVNLDKDSMSLQMMKEIRGPVLLQSSHWGTLARYMELLPGKGIASSIDLGGGEKLFLARAAEIRRLGFALSLKPVDENGLALGVARQCQVFERMYKLLVGRLDLRPTEILFEPQIFLWGFGEDSLLGYEAEMQNIANYVKENLPLAHVLGKRPK